MFLNVNGLHRKLSELAKYVMAVYTYDVIAFKSEIRARVRIMRHNNKNICIIKYTFPEYFKLKPQDLPGKLL